MEGGMDGAADSREVVPETNARRYSKTKKDQYKREDSFEAVKNEPDESAQDALLTIPQAEDASLLNGTSQSPRSWSPGTAREDSSPIKEDPTSIKEEKSILSPGPSSPATLREAATLSPSTLREASTLSPATLREDSSSIKDDPTIIKKEPSSLSPSASSSGLHLTEIGEQIEMVEQIASKPLSEGQKGFLVSDRWLGRVYSRTYSEKAKRYPKEAAEGEVGPIDNGGLNLVVDPTLRDLKDEKGDPYIPLRPGLQIGSDFQVVPKEAWDLIISWYGLSEGSEVITRYCHNISDKQEAEHLVYEIYPPIFTILKLPDHAEAETAKFIADKISRPVKILASREETFQSFLSRAKKSANIDTKVKVRIWKIHGNFEDGASSATLTSGTVTPEQSRTNSPAPGTGPIANAGQSLVIDLTEFLQLETGSRRELVEMKDETANHKYNGSSTLRRVGLGQDQIIVLEEQVQGPAGGEWASDANQHKLNGIPAFTAKGSDTIPYSNLRPKPTMASGRTSPTPSMASTSMTTRGREQKMGKPSGTVGLSNLGNTCYMNSALQCLRSVKELAPYFTTGTFKSDINMENPLGKKGALAKAYAALLGELYSDVGKNSFSPRNFKNTVGHCNNTFLGLSQQDSQEFLGWLLSDLEEDLNRIKDKPYITKPDSTDEMVHDPEALRTLAEECWNIYKARNDSVISDLFAGVYKSTLTCPECNKVSISFDPFNTVTLPLPIDNVWVHNVWYFPIWEPPVMVPVDVDKNATFLAIKEFLATKFGSDAKKLIVAEIYKNIFWKVFDDVQSIREEHILENDIIACYELEAVPTNWPAPKKSEREATTYQKPDQDEQDEIDYEDPIFDNMLVSVFHRLPKASAFKGKGLFGVPSFIVIPRKKAKNYDGILSKVLSNVQNMTTLDLLNEETSSDEDSDARQVRNVKSPFTVEKLRGGNLEDVTMHDAGEDTQGTSQKARPPGKAKEKAASSLPRTRPDTTIKRSLLRKFHLKVFPTKGCDMIPTGYTTLDDNNPYEVVLDRMAKQKTMKEKQRKTPSDEKTPSDGNAPVPSAAPRAPNDPDDELPPIEKLTQPKPGPRKKTPITYARKGKPTSTVESKKPNTVSYPYIRPYEAILCDWESKAYDNLFEGDPDDANDHRGTATYASTDPIEDLAFQERQKQRAVKVRDGLTLTDCINEFGKAEVLAESDAWYCPRCKAHRRASKTLELWKCPDILVMHLKRFGNGVRGRDKLTVFVDFPIEGLDLTSNILGLREEDGRAIYDLFAVDNHEGILSGGHYTAYAKNYYDENWYLYNDSFVSRVKPESVVTPQAYLLFYRRRSDKPLGGPFFEQLLHNTTVRSREASPSGEGMRLDDSSRNGSSSALPAAEAVHQAGDGGPTSNVQKDDNQGEDEQGNDEQGGNQQVEDEQGGKPQREYESHLPHYGPAGIPYTPYDMLAQNTEDLEDEILETADKAIATRPETLKIGDPFGDKVARGGEQPQLYLGPLGTINGSVHRPEEWPRNINVTMLPVGGGWDGFTRPWPRDDVPRPDSAGSTDANPPSPKPQAEKPKDLLSPHYAFIDPNNPPDYYYVGKDNDKKDPPKEGFDEEGFPLPSYNKPSESSAAPDQNVTAPPKYDPLPHEKPVLKPASPPRQKKDSSKGGFDAEGFPTPKVPYTGPSRNLRAGPNEFITASPEYELLPHEKAQMEAEAASAARDKKKKDPPKDNSMFGDDVDMDI